MDIQAIIFKIIEEINPAQLGILFAFGWYFYNKLDKKFESKLDNLDKKFESRFEKLETKLDIIDRRVQDIDKRLFVVETLLHMKECCMLKSDAKEKAQ
jgi:hypothetical protein